MVLMGGQVSGRQMMETGHLKVLMVGGSMCSGVMENGHLKVLMDVKVNAAHCNIMAMKAIVLLVHLEAKMRKQRRLGPPAKVSRGYEKRQG